jgi:hypothetical protein
LHYLHNNVLVIDQSEYIEDRPVPGPFPDFPMTKREKPWERGWRLHFHEFHQHFEQLPKLAAVSQRDDLAYLDPYKLLEPTTLFSLK